MLLKESECGTGRATEAIDGLVRVSHGKDVAFFSRQFLENLDLSKIDVLEFVRQDEAGAPALDRKQFGILLEQGMRLGDHVAEGAQIILLQHALDRGKYAGDFPATPDDFFVGQSVARDLRALVPVGQTVMIVAALSGG